MLAGFLHFKHWFILASEISEDCYTYGSENVTQLGPILCDPMDCVLEWAAHPFSRGCSRPRKRGYPALQADSLPTELSVKLTYPVSEEKGKGREVLRGSGGHPRAEEPGPRGREEAWRRSRGGRGTRGELSLAEAPPRPGGDRLPALVESLR